MAYDHKIKVVFQEEQDVRAVDGSTYRALKTVWEREALIQDADTVKLTEALSDAITQFKDPDGPA